MVTGFLKRAEFAANTTFARHGVFGKEPDLEIMGVWLIKSNDEDVPQHMEKTHPQFEFYKKRKLNPRHNESDDKLVR